MDIFNWFGSILGYLLWFIYEIVPNYGIAILLFTLIIKILMFPFSVKQQKSMASQTKVQKKVKELQKIYANDRMKLQMETQKLYEKEGVSMTGGCLPMLIPFPIMLGLYYSVLYPLRNALHIAADRVTEATQMLQQIPGIGTTFTSGYGEMEIIKHFDSLKGYLTMFQPEELDRIQSFSTGFKFLGLDLLATPSTSPFSSMLWLIPVLCLVTSLGANFAMQKLQPGAQQQAGCMKVMMYGFPFFTAWLAWTMPAAVGFYWTLQTLLSFVQTLVTHRFYSPQKLTAQAEAARVARRREEEGRVKELPPHQQIEVRKQLEAKYLYSGKGQKQDNKKNGDKKASQGKKRSRGQSSQNSQYLGSKK